MILRKFAGFLTISGLVVVLTASVMLQTSEAFQTIELVNGLRTSLGLYTYTVDSSLNAAAQAHATYQASTGILSHTGAGSTRPRDRVASTGYAAAGQFFVHENIYTGSGAQPSDAFNWWRNSAIHYEGMTSPRYVNIGAGVAFGADGRVYYTVLFAVRTGDSPPPVSSGGEDAGVGVSQPAFEIAQPGEDGSIWHRVQSGQTVSQIAGEYGVDIYDLMELNVISEENPLIFVDQMLMIRPPSTPTPEPSPTSLPTTPRPTAQPSVSMTAEPVPSQTAEPQTGDAVIEGTASLKNQVRTGLLVIVVAGLLTAGIGAGVLLFSK